MKIKKGDKVIVIAGKNKGVTGVVTRAFPADDKVLIDGVNVVKRHRKPSAARRAGEIVSKPMPIHVSNVMIADPKTGKPTRIKIVRGKDGLRERVAVKSGEKIK